MIDFFVLIYIFPQSRTDCCCDLIECINNLSLILRKRKDSHYQSYISAFSVYVVVKFSRQVFITAK
jgi:hypothetical protein